ncbi:LysR family transcriptional regulator [Caballeronia temeraria]|uniref:LysR family transcriptional regulator n=1 Tax=Caballeronia temeraria TaxID=1777137 RepID=A0A158DWB5_9BURK|nr:LysR substrate-binding domain-containing protein [Caballeronia temeraria]SAK98868.1 LysR family transcriptional regulator [Caballeronia temeraria]
MTRRSDRIQFDLKTLRLFEATAELGAITKAAERLALAPAAASRRISEIETQFGVALFERRPHGMTLTDAGRALLAHARSIIHSAERMHQDAAAFRQGARGVVKIAACTSAVLQFLAEDVQRCHAVHPGIDIDLQEANSHGVMQALTRGTVDIGIYEASLGRLDLPTRPYREDRLVVLTTADHPLAAQSQVRAGELLACDVIGLTVGSAISIALSRLASQMDRTLHMRIRVGSFDSMTAMVAAGVGVGVMPLGVARVLATDRHFRILPIEGEWPMRQMLLCHLPADELSSSTLTVLDLLTQPVSQKAKPA